jgi:hypothetical protein
LGEILEEEGVHGPLEADMQLADLALSQSNDPHIGEAHPFEEAGGVFLVAADTIERFRINEIEGSAACILHEGLDSRSQ